MSSAEVSILCIYQNGSSSLNTEMFKDINHVRRDNAHSILNEQFSGTLRSLADALDVAPGFVSRFLSNNPASSRNIGDSLARRIEQVANKPTNWLDHDHEMLDETMVMLAQRYRAAPPDVQAMIRLALDDPSAPISEMVRPTVRAMIQMVRLQIAQNLRQ